MGGPSIFTAREREHGYRAALAEAGLAVDERLIAMSPPAPDRCGGRWTGWRPCPIRPPPC
ncbi:hypothetical protein Misp01_11670 [Microtetraspora sp. NBRC 13810]|uniref:hypothetical protein n=1 Tax=Microtetraspora sp. NBRC 13810 TaxID=3030990 RepID=UPI00249FC5AA|nr:hypothetical protein [Microtetraspora sp. NBRC 13810]GLW06037.1 hypothetical protein Misp01_11670 [Microtetraspora sp. NBRC 13810]